VSNVSKNAKKNWTPLSLVTISVISQVSSFSLFFGKHTPTFVKNIAEFLEKWQTNLTSISQETASYYIYLYIFIIYILYIIYIER
jgi:hypothetical protein